MKPLFFLTSNQDKLREVRALLPHVQGIALDLPEIQELDGRKILAAKLAEAQKYHPGPLMVEDMSLCLEALNGLPGPLVCWVLQAIGCEGIFHLTTPSQNTRATAQTIIGYAAENGRAHFFSGVLSGTLVPPRGNQGFGWDAIFQPDGQSKTFAEMNPNEKSQFSMRRKALEGLRAYLSTVAPMEHLRHAPEPP